MKRAIAILLVIADLVLLAWGSHLIWNMRDQGYAGSTPSDGAVALRHFFGAFPFGPALVLFGIPLLAAGLIYPWPPRVPETESEAELPQYSRPTAGVWPPPPVNPEAKRPKKAVHHWARPDQD